MLRYWHAIRYQPTWQVVGRLRHAASMAVCRCASSARLNGAIERLCDLRVGRVEADVDFRFPDENPYPSSNAPRPSRSAASAEGEIGYAEPAPLRSRLRFGTGKLGGDSAEVQEQVVRGGFLGGNRFRFLEQEVDFGASIDWDAPDKALLWQFHLHYFDWLPGLARQQPELAFEQVNSWIGSNPAGSQPAWHPYPASLRIVNWVRAMAARDAGFQSEQIRQSLARQAAFVEANLEYHLGGNHLIENTNALLVAGLFFRGAAASRWESRGLRLLVSELEKQVLADGGHFERSLSYHFRVNLVCREAISLLRANGRGAPDELIAADRRMSRFTAQLLHEDGNIPLFHDSQLIEEEAWTRFHSLQPA